jgi:hypothetical protein
MTSEEYNRTFDIKCRSKTGTPPTKEEMKFLIRMMKLYPETYSKMEKEVFEATRPFGSQQL